MEITEKWLGEIGGWQAMKAARALVQAGVVSDIRTDAGLVRGTAGSGKVRHQAGLRIRSRTDVENLCTCPASRGRGLICEHSLAVALAAIQPGSGAPSKSPGASASAASTQQPPVPSRQTEPPSLPEPESCPGQWQVFLPEGLVDAAKGGVARDRLAVFLKFDPKAGAETSRLAGWVRRQGLPFQTMPLSLSGSELGGLLNVLGGHERVYLGKPNATDPGRSRVTVADHPVRLQMGVDEAADGRLVFRWEGEKPRRLAPGAAPDPASSWWYCPVTHTFYQAPVVGAETAKLLDELTTRAPGRVLDVERDWIWLVRHRAELEQGLQITLRGDRLKRFHVVPASCALELTLDGSLQAIEATLEVMFEEHRWPVGFTSATAAAGRVGGRNWCNPEQLFPRQDRAENAVFYVRDVARERRAMDRMASLGFQLSGAGVWRMQGTEAVQRFYATDLPRLRDEFQIVEGERWRAVTRGVQRIAALWKPVEGIAGQGQGTGAGWLDLEFAYQAPDGFRLPRAEALRLVRSGRREVKAANGRRYVLDLAGCEELEESLRDVPAEVRAEGVRVRSDHAGYLLGETRMQLAPAREPGTIRSALGELGQRLREYQVQGVAWLEQRARSGRGGVLGDEMGLGKTVQSIALIKSLSCNGKETVNVRTGAALIVCPRSLLGNWAAELERFAPELNVLIWHGVDRMERQDLFSTSDVILTTYQLLVRDVERLSELGLRLLILDEASFVKNPDSEVAKAARRLKASARFGLSGTPLENGVRDLWSIYQIVLPGYLGSRESFKERFESPIGSGLDSPAGRSAAERLRKLVRPWFLRRTKREVLRDLPEKIEQVLWCNLSSAQQEIYRRLVEEGSQEIRDARRRLGQGGAKMTMFTVLLRLRQSCCDLRLTGVSESVTKDLDREDLSGKWSMWEERLEEIRESGGKVLIFSQFVQFLRLARNVLDDQKVQYCYLDGGTQDRESQVQRFRDDPGVSVFLISLKAGGYGLNLTAADHVILMDPWWNPAVESHVIDRAHRMGQEKVVTACRLVTRGTVEERILKLQEKKRGLIEATLDESSPIMAGLTEEDLSQLLEV